ncbi:hypothetical protein ALP66_04955, partial [Pseudomonas amygdali pv. photiniae]
MENGLVCRRREDSAMSQVNALQLTGISKSFDGFKAVDNLNFYVEENQVHVVIGPNGA